MDKQHFINLTVAFLCTVAIFAGISVLFPAPHDDTDPPGGYSNMNLTTDYLTGCQYLSRSTFLGNSALTPRMGADGKQICVKK